MEATDQSTDEQEDVTDSEAPGADAEDGEEVGDNERPAQTFEATIVRLDRKAAESLVRLAGL